MNGEEVDVIIGGPPCQSFSTVGQRKYDDRAKLSHQYLRILETVKPKMFLFENVKGILSMREIFYKTDEDGNTIYEEVTRHRGEHEYTKLEPVVDHYGELVMKKLADEFDRIGYDIQPMTMKATDFGVPQIRERVFIIGIKKGENIAYSFVKVHTVRYVHGYVLNGEKEYENSKNCLKGTKNKRKKSARIVHSYGFLV